MWRARTIYEISWFHIPSSFPCLSLPFPPFSSYFFGGFFSRLALSHSYAGYRLVHDTEECPKLPPRPCIRTIKLITPPLPSSLSFFSFVVADLDGFLSLSTSER